eukprot:363195-Chlamydomonas_euryale.AAC.2
MRRGEAAVGRRGPPGRRRIVRPAGGGNPQQRCRAGGEVWGRVSETSRLRAALLIAARPPRCHGVRSSDPRKRTDIQ